MLEIWFRNADGTRTMVSAANPLPTTATLVGGGDASAANQVLEVAAIEAVTAAVEAGNALLTSILAELGDTTAAATRETPYTDVQTMAEDTPLSPAAEGVMVNCTTAGTVTFANVGGDSFTLNFAVGLSRLEGIEIAQFTAVAGGFVGTIFGLRR